MGRFRQSYYLSCRQRRKAHLWKTLSRQEKRN